MSQKKTLKTSLNLVSKNIIQETKHRNCCIKRILGDTGIVKASCDHTISITGGNGIVTSGNCSNLTISGQGLQLFDYVVAEDGSGNFLTLNEAVEAIIANNQNNVNVFVKTGNYSLPNLDNERKINFLAESLTTDPSVILHGETTSHGNKNWVGFNFQGSTTVVSDDQDYYRVDNLSSPNKLVDYFFNCEFTQNFRIEVNGDTIIFDNCLFFYEDIIRNNLIIVEAGTGKIQCFNCSFWVGRYGSSAASVAHNFILMQGNTQETSTIFLDCNVVIIVQGTTPYIFANIVGSQTVNIQNFNVRVRNSNGNVTLLGHESFSKDINLTVSGCNMSTESGSETATVIFMSNLWSPLPLNNIQMPITVTNCILKRVRLLQYDAPTEEREQYLRITHCEISTIIGPTILINMIPNSTFNLWLMHLDVEFYGLNTPFMQVSGTGGTVNLTAVFLYLLYTAGGGVQPWGQSSGVTVNIFYNNVVTDGFTTQFSGPSVTIAALPNTVTN